MPDYFYDMDLVVDPLNPSNVVAKGQVSIYDPADTTGTTLLALKDPSGLPLPNPLTSNANGFLPPRIATVPQTLWKSGAFEGYFNSYKGLRDEAVSAVTAAQGAADAATTAVAEVVTTAAVDGAGTLVLTKANGSTVNAGSVRGPQGTQGPAGQNGSNVLPTDTAIQQAITTPGTATAAALSATILDGVRGNSAAKFKAAAAALDGTRKPANLRLGTKTSTVSTTAHAAFPGMAVCKDGSLLVVWRQATSHEPIHQGVIKARKYAANGTPLTAEYTVLTDPLDLRDPMLTVLDNGDILVQYFKHDSTATTIAGVWVAKSSDNGATFQVLSKVPYTWDSLAACAGRVVVAPNGDWLVAAYGRTSATFNHIRLMRSTNKGVSWTGEVTVAEGQAESRNYVEPVLGIRPDGSIMCLIRVSDSNGSNPAIYSTTSTDNGLTWTAETSIIAGAGGRPAWISLASGGILLVNRLVGAGNVMQFRTSWDNGATWTTATQIGKTPISQGTYAQPVEVAPGLVAVAWGIEDNAASSSTITWGYIADGKGWSPAGDDFTEAGASLYPADVAVVDTFQRADAATLGTTETGQPWTVISGGIGIKLNGAEQNTDAGTSIVLTDSGIANGWIEGGWRFWGGAAGCGFVLRWVDASNYMFTAIESGGGTLKLYKYDNGSLGTLGTVTGMALAADTWHAVRVGMSGSKITVTVNGVKRIDYTATAAEQSKFGNATTVGLRATLNGARFGNFVVRRNNLFLPALV